MFFFERKGEYVAEDWGTESRGRSIIYSTKAIKKTTLSGLEDSRLVTPIVSV